MNGTIDKKEVSQGVSKSGKAFVRTVYTIDGMKYSSFEKYNADVGDEVTFEFNQVGEYRNLTALNIATKQRIEEERIAPPTFEQAKNFVGKSKQMRYFCANDPEKLVEVVNAFGAMHLICAWSPPVQRVDGKYETFLCVDL